MLKTDSRSRSAVGRISREDGEARLRPLKRPPTTRIDGLLVPWSQIALAVIATLGAARRAVAVGFVLVARARVRAAGALHQHAPALAVGNQRALAGRLERLFAPRRLAIVIGVALLPHRELRARLRDHLVAELLAQHARLDFIDRTLRDLAQLERTVGHPDQPVHLEAEMRQHVAHLAVLAPADREHQPDIGALVALQRRIDRTVFDAVDLDAVLQLVELRLRHLAVGADAITAQPAGIGQFEHAREPAVVGQQQQALGVEIEPADRDQPRQAFRQMVEHRGPPFGVGMRRHQAARLVIEKQPRALARWQWLAVNHDDIVRRDIERWRIDHAAVDGDAPLHNPLFGVAARGKACARHRLGDALAGLLRLRFLAGSAPVEIRLALAIAAAPTERRALGKNPAVVFTIAAGPIGKPVGGLPLAAGMVLPVGAAFGPLPRTLEISVVAMLARTVEFRTILAPLMGAIEFRTIEIARTVARRTRIAFRTIRTGPALLPRLGFAAGRAIA